MKREPLFGSRRGLSVESQDGNHISHTVIEPLASCTDASPAPGAPMHLPVVVPPSMAQNATRTSESHEDRSTALARGYREGLGLSAFLVGISGTPRTPIPKTDILDHISAERQSSDLEGDDQGKVNKDNRKPPTRREQKQVGIGRRKTKNNRKQPGYGGVSKYNTGERAKKSSSISLALANIAFNRKSKPIVCTICLPIILTMSFDVGPAPI